MTFIFTIKQAVFLGVGSFFVYSFLLVFLGQLGEKWPGSLQVKQVRIFFSRVNRVFDVIILIGAVKREMSWFSADVAVILFFPLSFFL